MKNLLFLFWLGFICVQLSLAQQRTLEFRLVDELTEKPISEAHIFINNSSIGTTSDGNGFLQLNVFAQETQELIITHVLYETLLLSPEKYHKLKKNDFIKMQSKSVHLDEVMLTNKKNSQWKKNFRKFRKTLLGNDKAASSCKILNPEVLQFEEENGKLTANAFDLLEIENDYLGYTIRFSLEELSIDEDGSSSYKGYGQYIDKSENDTRYIKRRDKVYGHSISHFLLSLLESSNTNVLKDFGYGLTFEAYNNGVFKLIREPIEPRGLVHTDSTSGWYQLYFSEYLTIKHEGIKVSSSNSAQIPVSSAEQQKFGAGSSQSLNTIQQNAISRLYKTDDYLVFDKRGNIINKSAIRQFGFWAEQRLAKTLPIDYIKISDFELINSTEAVIDTLTVLHDFIGADDTKKMVAYKFLQQNWTKEYIAPLLDILRLSQNDWQQTSVKALLDEHVPNIKSDYFEGIQWLWKNEPHYGKYYANFKGYLYSAIDPVFYNYFNGRDYQTKIRLDEIVWGGVKQDGIPPLISPKMMNAYDASYLANTDVVFGLVVNGEARAYPKRILAWHEFLTDTIGEQSIAVVYCTLCGTVIIYDTEFKGIKHQLGTSGFLYRSNKLMYDHDTQSLWSTMLGEPVVGPLVDQDIVLNILPVETTTWEVWHKRYPNTKVLSLETGHSRDYSEGEAYKNYFANDNLMFPVVRLDKRLPNKARVFIPRPTNFETEPIAISVDYLKRKGLHQDTIDEKQILILTESNGASRAYAIGDQEFKSYKDGKLLDDSNRQWQVSDDALISPEGKGFARIPAHEAFWFAWYNVFPETRLVYHKY